MDMVDRFQKYIQNPLCVRVDDLVVLAVSGGRDSMLMAHLFLKLGYNCVVLHCNFNLRADESDKDEQLVVNFAKERGVPFYVKHFDTEDYARLHNISIQMAARELRYAWFEQQRHNLNADWIAVAQHRNDHIETAFINLCRGTGIVGLQGILPERGHIIRPLLFAGSTEITETVKQLGIPYRDDQSNFSTKYLRNKIRIDILPKFQEITPDFDKIMVDNMERFRQSAQLLDYFIQPIKSRLFRTSGNIFSIEKKELSPYIDNRPLLYELFREFEFSLDVLQDLQDSFHGIAGKVFHSPKFELLLDRDKLSLRRKGMLQEQASSVLLDNATSEAEFGGVHFSITITDELNIIPDRLVCQVDYEDLVFPLEFRFWKKGDFFCPLGMKGTMKVSDFFVHQKIDLFQKEHVPILVNGNGDIIWIVKYRIDNRYRIDKQTKKVFIIKCN